MDTSDTLHDERPDSSFSSISRREVLKLGVAAAGGFAGALAAGCASPSGSGGIPSVGSGSIVSAQAIMAGSSFGQVPAPSSALTHDIETILQAPGQNLYGVLQIEIDREDIPNVHLRGVPILPSFEINGDITFQCLGGTRVIMNADMALKASEIDPFIDQLIAHNIIFQAEHQHFYDFEPMVWFIHFRAVGDAITIARGVKAALNVTSTPFPQTSPPNPTTPLPAKELGQILGAEPQIGSNGVVTYYIPRANPMTLNGIHISPYLNIFTSVAFEPLGGGNAACVPDFGMVSSEIQKVMQIMRYRHWDIGCLYNQETDEQPQLFFSHQFKTGNAVELAREVRSALNVMDVAFKPVS